MEEENYYADTGSTILFGVVFGPALTVKTRIP